MAEGDRPVRDDPRYAKGGAGRRGMGAPENLGRLLPAYETNGAEVRRGKERLL